MSTELERVARELAATHIDRRGAVEELLRLACGTRVSLVRAREHLLGEPDEELGMREAALIDEALERVAIHG